MIICIDMQWYAYYICIGFNVSTKKHRLDNGQPSPTKCIQQAIQPSKQHRPWWLHYRWPSVRLVKLTTGSNSGKPRQLVPFPFSHPLELWTCRIGEKPKTTQQKKWGEAQSTGPWITRRTKKNPQNSSVFDTPCPNHTGFHDIQRMMPGVLNHNPSMV